MKLLNQFTTMTNNGIWTVGPSDDPKMHTRISEGGFALLKAKAAPAGWEKRLSGTNGREFLHNPATGQSQWPKTGASYEKQASIQAFREECMARRLEQNARLSESQGSDASNPFGTGPVTYDTQTMHPDGPSARSHRQPEPEPEALGPEGRAKRERLVKFAASLGPELRSGRSSALGDAAVVDAMRKIHRRVTSDGGKKPRPAAAGSAEVVATARTDISAGTEPTVRMSRVGGAMVNVLSTARIEKKLERNRRRTERFERKMAELQRHEKEVSDKLKDAQVSRSGRKSG